MTTSVFIADDHPVVLSGLKAIIDTDRQFSVLGTAQDGAATVAALRQLQPDIALVDLNMPRANGLSVLISAHNLDLSTRIIILAAAATDDDIHALVESNVNGLLFKESAATDLLACLRTVADGGRWFSPSITDGLARYDGRVDIWQRLLGRLTAQERRIARLAGAGQTNKQIAYALEVSEGTVKVHLNSIYRKLGLASRSDLMKRAAGLTT